MSVFSPNTGKYGPEKTPYFDTFPTVLILEVLPDAQNNYAKNATFFHEHTNKVDSVRWRD